MARQNKVKQMSREQRDSLHKMLDEGRTLDEIVDVLATMGADVSRSGLGRYKQHVDKVSARLRESREAAEVIAQKLGPESIEGQQGRALVNMLSSIVFGHLVHRMDSPDGEADIDELRSLARTIKDMQMSSLHSQEFEHKIRDAAHKEAEGKLAKATALAEKEAGEAGLNAADVLERVRAIYRGEA